MKTLWHTCSTPVGRHIPLAVAKRVEQIAERARSPRFGTSAGLHNTEPRSRTHLTMPGSGCRGQIWQTLARDGGLEIAEEGAKKVTSLCVRFSVASQGPVNFSSAS